ncbi:SDR family oxidoreductase [Kitasatospora sp. NPDC086801]|uniref:SDR family oxidoreductase n=1 Tax=Kitasatospora sp. NPDC086801 TaxID=3364066 RepID=UPI00380B9FCA
MSTLITGATGFLGSHLLLRLLRQGRPVTALVRQQPDTARARLARALKAAGAQPEDLARLPHVTLLRADLTVDRLGLTAPQHCELAAATEEIWHSAAGIDLNAPLAALLPSNVDGTRRVLDLAGQRPGGPARVVHVSTAFVAGGRPDGIVGEEDLTDRYGFLLPYEETKYRGELLLRAWAQRTGAAVTVLRPSVLISHRPVPPGAPHHPQSAVGVQLALAAARGPAWLAGQCGVPLDADGRLPARVHTAPGSVLNLVPADYAADAMLRLAALDPHRPGVRTHHVVHPTGTPVRRWLAAMAARIPWLDLRIEPEPVPFGPVESYLCALRYGGERYALLTRRYDRATLDRSDRAAGIAPPGPLDGEYLADAFGPRRGGVQREPSGSESASGQAAGQAPR